MSQESSFRESLIDADRAHIWRPYTSSKDHLQMEPFVISHAEGSWLVDENGNRYLDANGSWWCNNLGHGHPRIKKVLQTQSEKLIHCSLAGVTHEHAALLAKELTEIAPTGLQKVFYSDNGSTSVEVALKMAFQYWIQIEGKPRTNFVSLSGSYHGDTFGAMSVGGVSDFHGIFEPLFFQSHKVDMLSKGDAFNEGFEPDFTSLQSFFEQSKGSVIAIIVEPLVQGASGMRTWSAQSLRRISEIAKQQNTLLIADEVFTGFGRTGALWACDQANITPDILCTAKGLSAGTIPFAATLATSQIFEAFMGDKNKALMHGHTFCGNPLGAAIAREVIQIYKEENIVEQVVRKSSVIEKRFKKISQISGVRRARSLGMMGAVDLSDHGYMGELGWKVFEEAKKNLVYLRPLGDTVYVCPPLTITDTELNQLLDVVEHAIEKVL